MDEGESILGAIYEDDNLEDVEDVEDVEMLDVEEGEFLDHNTSSLTNVGQNSGGDVNFGNQGSQNKNRRRRASKKKNKRKRSGLGPNFTDINRFVADTCKHLKERKSYMVYTAVGCLGVSALGDLIKEVDAIQACGGQMTADGRRSRTGGGILWSIVKARSPAAYKEIMKKTKEFEKQFRQQNNKLASEQMRKDSSQNGACAPTNGISPNIPDGSQLVSQNQHEESNAEGKRKSIHDRIRVPVSYDDLLGEDPKTESP